MSFLDLQHFVAHTTQVVIRVPEVLDALREVVDVVILEVPSFLSVHHGQGLAPLADLVLIVGERRLTTMDQLRKTSAVLKRLGAPVVGLALTDPFAIVTRTRTRTIGHRPDVGRPASGRTMKRTTVTLKVEAVSGVDATTVTDTSPFDVTTLVDQAPLRFSTASSTQPSGTSRRARRPEPATPAGLMSTGPARPLIFISILIAVGLFALGRVVIRRIAPLESDPWLYKALTVCLVLHLLAAPVQIWVVDHLYGGIADYNRYDSQGAVLSNGFRHFDFSLAPAHLRGIVSDGSVGIVAGVVFAIIGVNQLGAFLVFSWLSFIGIIFFYLAFTTTFGGAGSRRYGYLLFFLPTLIFWTSDVSKEAIMTFLMGLTAYGCARILAHRGGYWMVIAGSAGGVFIRPNEVLLALGGFTLAMLFRPADPNTKFAGPRRTVALILLGSMLGVAIFVTLHFLPGTTGSISLTEISKNNNSAKGTAGFGSSNLGYSPSMLAYPKDVYSVLFDPLPINAHGGGQWITALREHCADNGAAHFAPPAALGAPGGAGADLRDHVCVLHGIVPVRLRRPGEPGPHHPRANGDAAVLPRAGVHSPRTPPQAAPLRVGTTPAGPRRRAGGQWPFAPAPPGRGERPRPERSASVGGRPANARP